jgi:hypothetical protein
MENPFYAVTNRLRGESAEVVIIHNILPPKIMSGDGWRYQNEAG